MKELIKPPKLNFGDTIGIISPSAPLAGLVPHRTERAIKAIEKLGFNVKTGKNALKISGHTAGSAIERAADINDFFKDKSVKAIISFIGGNHSNQSLKYLDFQLIKNNPKIFLGYSDITVLHLALFSQADLTTFYGPAALTQFGENPSIFEYTLDYLKKALMNLEPIGEIKPSQEWTDETLDWFKKLDLERPRKMQENKSWQWLKKGNVTGPILGGCITSMMHLRGTKYWPDFSESILFWEIPESDSDFTKGEKPANIDAYLADLELSGVFSKIKGMIIGRPFGYTDDETKELIEIILKNAADYNFPIIFNIDIGHTDPMITIPLGVKVRIDSEKDDLVFLESGVSE